MRVCVTAGLASGPFLACVQILVTTTLREIIVLRERQNLAQLRV